MKKNDIVVYMKEYSTNKKIVKLLQKINPLLSKGENNLRIHLEALVNNGITEHEFKVIDAKVKLGQLCLDLERLITNSFATILFYVKEENKIYHGAAPNIPLHHFEFFHEVNEKQLFHEMICNRAITSGDVVYSEIFSDPQCIHERQMALERGFQSVWSIPFYQHDSIIGTFAIYQSVRKKPTKQQIQEAKEKVLEYQDEIDRISNNLFPRE